MNAATSASRLASAPRRAATALAKAATQRQQVKRATWQVKFLIDELGHATTNVERGVILDWLEAATERRNQLQAGSA